VLASVNFGNVNTDALLYTAPSGGARAVVSVNFCNRATGSVKVRLAFAAPSLPPAAGGDTALEFDTSIPVGASLERTGIVLKPGQSLYGRTDTLGVNAVVYGIEE
jgi:hypothetical protein